MGKMKEYIETEIDVEVYVEDYAMSTEDLLEVVKEERGEEIQRRLGSDCVVTNIDYDHPNILGRENSPTLSGRRITIKKRDKL